MEPSSEEILRAAAPLIELALAEDIGPGDATSEATLPPDLTVEARILAKASGIVAGLPIVEQVLRRVEPRLEVTRLARDGDAVVPGQPVLEVRGPARGMLAAERTALNFLQHLSGIATLTHAFVTAVAGTTAAILDTRKTHPGYRVLEKYAVRMGGGKNHRMGLHDMLLVKDNHIAAAGSLTAAVQMARAAYPHLACEVEVKSLAELREALALDVQRIMLDNMSLEEMRAAVEETAGRVELEASGNMSLARVAAVAATGVDFISVGAITHSAPALDFSMDVRTNGADGQTPRSHQGQARRAMGRCEEASTTRRTERAAQAVARAKATLGPALVILGHHYQRDDVIQFADFRGDSLQLAHDAARSRQAETIVFCGVHFMAETAAILAQPHQRVLLPDLEAGCPLAEMASLEDVEEAWRQLGTLFDVEHEVMPVTYVNSSAAPKAFCGAHGGLVCTASNAAAALVWALERRPRVLFFPDQHLGRNTAKRQGIPLDEMALWNPARPLGGNAPAALERARIILWRGWCNVHQRFRPEHVLAWRAREPAIRVIVHPECPMEVVDLADEAGSTAAIIRRIAAAPPGTKWAVGTEWNLVHRLQQEHPEQMIASLSPEPSACRTMNKITLPKLARVLEALLRGEIIHQVTVPETVARSARVALERMLEVRA